MLPESRQSKEVIFSPRHLISTFALLCDTGDVIFSLKRCTLLCQQTWIITHLQSQLNHPLTTKRSTTPCPEKGATILNIYLTDFQNSFTSKLSSEYVVKQ